MLAYTRLPVNLNYWVDLLPASARLRRRALAHGGAADDDRARRRERGRCGHRVGSEQRRRADRRTAAIAVLGITAAGGTGHLTAHGFHVTMAVVAGAARLRRRDRRDRDPQPGRLDPRRAVRGDRERQPQPPVGAHVRIRVEDLGDVAKSSSRCDSGSDAIVAYDHRCASSASRGSSCTMLESRRARRPRRARPR